MHVESRIFSLLDPSSKDANILNVVSWIVLEKLFLASGETASRVKITPLVKMLPILRCQKVLCPPFFIIIRLQNIYFSRGQLSTCSTRSNIFAFRGWNAKSLVRKENTGIGLVAESFSPFDSSIHDWSIAPWWSSFDGSSIRPPLRSDIRSG